MLSIIGLAVWLTLAAPAPAPISSCQVTSQGTWCTTIAAPPPASGPCRFVGGAIVCDVAPTPPPDGLVLIIG